MADFWVELTVSKLVGVGVLLLPFSWRFEEWVFTGFFIVLI